jgi:hypothetical protein
MNGSNGGTTFTDYSPVPKTITRYNAVTSTAQSKYYGSSGYFDGSGDYLSVASAGVNFGTGDFTVEMWLRIPSLPGGAYMDILDTRTADSTGFSFGITSGGAVYLYSISAFRVNTGSFSTGAWHHVAITRASGSIKVFLDGTQVGSTWDASAVDYQVTTLLVGKYYAGSAVFLGYINDLRITKGAARYTTTFTPPTQLLGSISGTVTDDTATAAERTIITFPRLYPTQVKTTSSAVDGSYSFANRPVTDHSVIVLDDDAGALYNDLIMRVIPG